MNPLQERWVGGSLVLLALASGAWFGLHEAKTRAEASRAASRSVPARSEAELPAPEPLPKDQVWGQPPLAKRGPAWTFELFSPPEILVDRARHSCWVRCDEEATAPAQRPDPDCPLGLLGFFGTGGAARVVLELTDTHRVVTARIDEWIGDCGWRVDHLETAAEVEGGFAVVLEHRDGRRIRIAAGGTRNLETRTR